MKKIKYAFALLGFVFQYVIPLILFGGVIPYTHDGVAAGLTKMGCAIIAIFCIIVIGKLKAKLIQRPKSLLRGFILSLFPVALWGVMYLLLGWLGNFVASLVVYWDKIILFIVLGRLFYTIDEGISASEASNDETD